MFRGVPLPSISSSYQWGHWIFCLGGGNILFGYSISSILFLGFFYRCFDFVVLISVVYSIFSCSAYWFCFVFSITCSCRKCLGLVESIAHCIVFFYVSESCVSCLCVF